jgi:prepilin-type N-terminal cleavage/methylation domain-containing protein
MRHIRRGTTLIEQLVVIAILAIVTAIAVTTAVRQLDAAAVHAASREVADAFAAARDHAMASGRRTAVRVRARDTVLLVHADDDLLEQRRLGLTYGVSVTGTRDSMAYAPTGLGWGAANLSVRIARGRAADTVTVSRLGRVSR